MVIIFFGEQIMKSIEKYILILLIGGLGYGFIEIAFRGYTHWSMVITGASAYLCLYIINEASDNMPILLKSVAGAIIITVMELSVGLVVNRHFDMAVWDYTSTPFNFLGIISLPFTACWFIMSFILISMFNFGKALLQSRNFENLNTVRVDLS